MNVIYLNENLQYCEAFPDSRGRIIIPEKNVICGWVDQGMQYALKDPNNEVLTPIETFIQFNDMSVSFIQPHHFKGAQRVIELDNRVFCELRQVFSCASFLSPFATYEQKFAVALEREDVASQSNIIHSLKIEGEIRIPDWVRIERYENHLAVTEPLIFYPKSQFMWWHMAQTDYANFKMYNMVYHWGGFDQLEVATNYKDFKLPIDHLHKGLYPDNFAETTETDFTHYEYMLGVAKDNPEIKDVEFIDLDSLPFVMLP